VHKQAELEIINYAYSLVMLNPTNTPQNSRHRRRGKPQTVRHRHFI